MMMMMKTTLNALLIMELLGLSSAIIKQHYFVNQMKTWFAARMYCITFYHDLSTFPGAEEENQFLTEATGLTSDSWVGLYRESGVWKWSDGENATQLIWNVNNQNDKDGVESCALLQKSGKRLVGEICSETNTFFCMTRFALVHQNETWEGALDYCRNNYNDLGSLSSTFRMNSALEIIKQTQTEYVWTALCFLAGEWLWVTGDDLDYTAWPSSGQPQCPDINLRCGAVDNQTSVWANRDCEEELNFICQ